MSWLDALLTKTFGPKGAPRLQFGELNAAIGATVEMKNRENVLRGDGGAWADIAAGALGSALTAPGKAGRALTDVAERFWHWLKVAVVKRANHARGGSSPRVSFAENEVAATPLEPGVKLERANAVSVKKAKRALVLEVPKTASQFLPTSEYDGTEDTEKVAFNKRKTYKAIREGQLLPTDAVPGLPGTTAGELLVRNLRLQYVSRLRRSKAKKARLDSGDSSSSS
eukprot:tig00020936_g16187.t1